MAWLLFLLGTVSGAGGLVALASVRLAIDKIETLLLFLIAAVLITGGAVVRAVDRSSRVLELQAAIRGGGAARVGAGAAPNSESGPPGEDPWPEDESGRRLRRVVNLAGAAFLAVALSLAALWLVVPHAK